MSLHLLKNLYILLERAASSSISVWDYRLSPWYSWGICCFSVLYRWGWYLPETYAV